MRCPRGAGHFAAARTCLLAGWLLAAAGCGRADLDGRQIPIHVAELELTAAGRTWNAVYRLPLREGYALLLGTGREIHVPIGADVRLGLRSDEFIADFKLPSLSQRDFAAPGLPGSMRFDASSAGRHELRGDELCGLPHDDRALGHLVVEEPAAYREWILSRAEQEMR